LCRRPSLFLRTRRPYNARSKRQGHHCQKMFRRRLGEAIKSRTLTDRCCGDPRIANGSSSLSLFSSSSSSSSSSNYSAKGPSQQLKSWESGEWSETGPKHDGRKQISGTHPGRPRPVPAPQNYRRRAQGNHRKGIGETGPKDSHVRPPHGPRTEEVLGHHVVQQQQRK
jgi:hypothetical protein